MLMESRENYWLTRAERLGTESRLGTYTTRIWLVLFHRARCVSSTLHYLFIRWKETELHIYMCQWHRIGGEWVFKPKKRVVKVWREKLWQMHLNIHMQNHLLCIIKNKTEFLLNGAKVERCRSINCNEMGVADTSTVCRYPIRTKK